MTTGKTSATRGATGKKPNSGLPDGFYDWPLAQQEKWLERFITDVWNARREKRLREQNRVHDHDQAFQSGRNLG
jgi:hypothetical protein